MHPHLERLQTRTRRHFLQTGSLGLGAAALSSLMGTTAEAKTDVPNPLAPKPSPLPAKAKRVIYLHMTGSPPNLDLFDYKPELVKHSGEECPAEYLEGKTFAFTKGVPKLLGTPRTFAQYGESGTWLSDALPNLRKVVDDLCVVKSMHTDEFNHAPAELFIYTGSPRPGRPSLGSWATYGLGSENANLPGFVVLISSGVQPNGGTNSFGSGFLPSVYQGVQCRSKGEPILYVSNPEGMDRQMRRESLDTLNYLNELQATRLADPETRTRIAQYELAFRMQTAVPEVMDISREPKHILESYGAQLGQASLANNCLLARRLVEQGVRFVQLFDWGWDFHGTDAKSGLTGGLTKKCASMDKPVSALITDLKQRGLLDETLVIWGGEFGRTPFQEGRTAGSKILGRDHYPDCFTMMMAGGGTRPGVSYGTTDPLGFSVTENPVHVHDLQATVLRQLGFDHEQFTYRFQGRDFRLTDVHGTVVEDLLGS